MLVGCISFAVILGFKGVIPCHKIFPSTDSNLVMLTANTIRENKQLKVELKEERDFISHVFHNETYYITPTAMANKFGLSAVKLNKSCNIKIFLTSS